MTRAGTSRKSIGKSGGEKPRRMRSRRLSTGERGPQIVHRHVRVPERREEAKALEVVEVQVRQEEVDPPRAAPDEVEPERADAGARVEHERRLAVEHHLDAGRVAAVRERVRPGRRQRAAATPDLQRAATRR